MSRLIDADALIQDMEMHVTTMSVCSTTIEARAKAEMKRTCIADVANAPTIAAIPVEWLRKWPKDLREGAYVRDILMDWQKEQEARA